MKSLKQTRNQNIDFSEGHNFFCVEKIERKRIHNGPFLSSLKPISQIGVVFEKKQSKIQLFHGPRVITFCVKEKVQKHLCRRPSHNPFYQLKLKSEIWEVLFEKSRSLRKRSKNENSTFWRVITFCLEKLGVIFYAAELPTIHSTH